MFEPRVELAAPDAASLWFIFAGDSLIVRDRPDGSCEPLSGDLALPIHDAPIPLGVLDGRFAYAATSESKPPLAPGLSATSLRALHARMDASAFDAASLGAQLAYFAHNYRFCARCAASLAPAAQSRARVCTRCKHEWYPRVSPCAIVLVRDGDRVLMTRQPRYPAGMYGLVAGFVEASESVERCAEREALEECGITVKNLRYFGSQPWSFPHQLMLGFVADYAGGELVVDTSELEEARWFSRDAMPSLPPSVSIARKMIDAFVADELG